MRSRNNCDATQRDADQTGRTSTSNDARCERNRPTFFTTTHGKFFPQEEKICDYKLDSTTMKTNKFSRKYAEKTEKLSHSSMRAFPEVAQICGFERKWVGCPNSMRADIQVAQAQHELTDPFRDCFDRSLVPCQKQV